MATNGFHHFYITPIFLYAHFAPTHDSPVISISHSQPFFFFCRFYPYTHDSPIIFISPIFLYAGFILCCLPELRKASLTHKMESTQASEKQRLEQIGVSEGGKEMMEENMAWIGQPLDWVNGLIVALGKGVQMIAI
jgi:hypothetical protein